MQAKGLTFLNEGYRYIIPYCTAVTVVQSESNQACDVASLSVRNFGPADKCESMIWSLPVPFGLHPLWSLETRIIMTLYLDFYF